MQYTLDTLEFSRKRIDLFLSMRYSDRIRLSKYSDAAWSMWIKGDRDPSMSVLIALSERLAAYSPLLTGLNPMEVAAGILIMRSRRIEKDKAKASAEQGQSAA